MTGRAFLDLARTLVPGRTEVYWRATAIPSSYALLRECRDAQGRWGFPLPAPPNVHATVRLRVVDASSPDLQAIAPGLDGLVQRRHRASYHRNPSPMLASAGEAHLAIQKAASAVALRDALEADPVRLAAARAAIRP